MSELQILEPSAAEELKQEDDPRYFVLSKPIRVGTRTIEKLLIDASALDGVSFFALVADYKRRWPAEARSFNVKGQDENYLTLVIAKLNDIAPEDLVKLTYGDLNILFLRAIPFQFSQGPK